MPIDLAARVDGEIRWDWPLYHKLAAAMKEAARLEGVQIEWGGDWKTDSKMARIFNCHFPHIRRNHEPIQNKADRRTG
jgi:hypothetical protein